MNVNNIEKNIGVSLPQKPKIEPLLQKQAEPRAQEQPKRETVQLNDALETLARAAGLFNKRLKFSVDSASNRVVVKIIDEKTDRVIKQIPPEEVLNFAAELRKMIGIFIDKQQ